MTSYGPKPPKMPPGQAIRLTGRGTTWVYDSGRAPSGATGSVGGGAEGANRPALLLLHGWTSTAALNWYKCFPALSQEYRVTAMDHRGHGRGIRSRYPFRLEDCADDAAAVIRRLDIGPATVVGYSMGGPIAQLLWRRHRDLVDGLVLCATATRLASRQQFSDPLGTMGLGASMALSLVPAGLRQRGMGLATHRWSANNQAAGWAMEEWARHDPAALVQAGMAISRFDSRPWVGEVDVPTAVVVTELDQTVSPAWQWSMRDAIAGSTAFPISANHRACVDDPDLFVPALISACRSTQRGRQSVS